MGGVLGALGGTVGRFVVFGSLVAAAALLSPLATPASAEERAGSACAWAWTDLPVPEGSRETTVVGSDGNGVRVGRASQEWPAPSQVVVWRGEVVEVLGTAFGQDTEVFDVNADAVVVGTAGNLPVRHRAGAWERLPVPEGTTRGSARRINDAGDVLGVLDVDRPILWRASNPGSYELLQGPAPGYTEYTDLADDGSVTAWGVLAGGLPRGGFVLRPGDVWRQVDRPEATPATYPHTTGGGSVVGFAYSADYGTTAQVEWDLDGRVLHTYADAYPVAVNASGRILGRRNSDWGLTIWRAGSVEAALPVPDGFGVGAVGLDDDGSVVAQASDPSGAWSKPVVARCS